MTLPHSIRCVSAIVLLLGCICGNYSLAAVAEGASGLDIMQDVHKRHRQYPYVYEEQSVVMQDRDGVRDTRLMRRYSRVERDGTLKLLLVFDYPKELKGVALLAIRDSAGNASKYIYLPALGEQLIESIDVGISQNFLGTDFSIENLTGEILSEYIYERRADMDMDGMKYYVIDVYTPEKNQRPKQLLRRHFVRQDNLFITLTHHFDKHGRLSRVQSHHDLKPVDGDMWQASMVLMEDRTEEHRSLIKIKRRVFSHDYVPEELFTAQWLFNNQPYIEPPQETPEASEETTGETAE